MPTNSPRLIGEILRTLAKLPFDWCVLHREDELLTGRVDSDVDLIVDRPPEHVVRELADRLAEQDILLIQTWEYDRCERSNFFVDVDTNESVQLDLLFDPRGKGVIGFKSDEFLRHSTPGVNWPTLSELDSVLYRTRKRQVKANSAALEKLRVERESYDPAALEARTRQAFEPHAQKHLLSLLVSESGREPVGWGKGPDYRLGTLRRRIRRLRAMPGVLAAVPQTMDGGRLAESLDPMLISAEYVGRLSPLNVGRVAARSLKPALTILDIGPVTRTLAATGIFVDLSYSTAPVPDLFRAMHVAAMQKL